MLNNTFVDDPDASSPEPQIVDTLNQKDEDSEFIGEWIQVQEESKRLNIEQLDGN